MTRFRAVEPEPRGSDFELGGLPGRNRTGGSDLIEGWDYPHASVSSASPHRRSVERRRPALDVDIGIDSHKRSFSAGVVDELGGVVNLRHFPNTPSGFAHFEVWADGHGDVRRLGIEGAGSYGAGLARHLSGRGFQVVEVPALLAHRERKRAPANGK